MSKHFSLGIMVLNGNKTQITNNCIFNFHFDYSFSVRDFLAAILSAGKRTSWLKANVHVPLNIQNI